MNIIKGRDLSNKEVLIYAVVLQLETDLLNGDYDAVEELLNHISITRLNRYLPDNEETEITFKDIKSGNINFKVLKW